MLQNKNGYNIYYGMRYVPLFMGDWDITKSYEPLSIVYYNGNSYTSRTFVPTNTEITNEDMWALTGNYNAQIEAYRQELRELQIVVSGMTGDVEQAKQLVAELEIKVNDLETLVNSYDNRINSLTTLVNTFDSRITANSSAITTINSAITTINSQIANITKILNQPITSGMISIEQKFIRAASDPWENGTYPDSTTTVQGFCVTPNGFMIAKQNEVNQVRTNNTQLIELNKDGTLRRRAYVNAGHANSMVCVGNSLFITPSTPMMGVIEFNYTTLAIIRHHTFNLGGRIGADKQNNILYGIYDELNLGRYNITTGQYTTHRLNKRVAHNQGGCWHNGYFYAITTQGYSIIDTETYEVLGACTFPRHDIKTFRVEEFEDFDVDENGQFYLNSRLYENTSTTLNNINTVPNTGTNSKQMVLTGFYIGMFDPINNILNAPLDQFQDLPEVYVSSRSANDWTDAKYQVGSSTYPFIGLHSASYYDNTIARLDCSNYTYIPDFGDVYEPRHRHTCNLILPSTNGGISPLRTRAPLLFRNCDLVTYSVNLTLSKPDSGTHYPISIRNAHIKGQLNFQGYNANDLLASLDQSSRAFISFNAGGEHLTTPWVYGSSTSYVRTNHVRNLGFTGNNCARGMGLCVYTITSTTQPQIYVPWISDNINRPLIIHFISTATGSGGGTVSYSCISNNNFSRIGFIATTGQTSRLESNIDDATGRRNFNSTSYPLPLAVTQIHINYPDNP